MNNVKKISVPLENNVMNNVKKISVPLESNLGKEYYFDEVSFSDDDESQLSRSPPRDSSPISKMYKIFKKTHENELKEEKLSSPNQISKSLPNYLLSKSLPIPIKNSFHNQFKF